MARRTIAGLRGILTGASSGIGRALAVELVRAGARIVAVARRAERLEALRAEFQNAVGQFEFVAGDISAPATRQAAIERAVTAFGGLDLVINNAGSGAMGRFAEASPERLRQIMEVNFFAAAELIRAAVPRLSQGQRPIVVNVSSVLGHRGVPGCAEYCASKFALQGLSESLRAELSTVGIDLLVVSPSTTETEFFDAAIGADQPKWPKLKGSTPEDVARKTIRAIAAGRHEIVLSAGGKLVVWANRFAPWFVDRILARYG